MRDGNTKDLPYSWGWARYVNNQTSTPLDLPIRMEEGVLVTNPNPNPNISPHPRKQTNQFPPNSLPLHYPTGMSHRAKGLDFEFSQAPEGSKVCMSHQTCAGGYSSHTPTHQHPASPSFFHPPQLQLCPTEQYFGYYVSPARPSEGVCVTQVGHWNPAGTSPQAMHARTCARR